MKNEIKNIRIVYKFGAYGDPNAFGRWIYGKRPDGRTVAYQSEEIEDGGIRIWSYWVSPSCNEHEIDTCETVFTAEEWKRIASAPQAEQSIVCNKILRTRIKSEKENAEKP